MTPRIKKKQPKCCICNKFLDREGIHYYSFVLFENVDSGEHSFIHKECWNNLSFHEKQKLVESMVIKNNIPMDAMYITMKDMHNKLLIEKRNLEYSVESLTKDVDVYHNLTMWHKYKKYTPKEDGAYWVTSRKGIVSRCVFEKGKFNENDHEIVAWAFILYPEAYNDICYQMYL